MSHDDNSSNKWFDMLKELEDKIDQLDEEQKSIIEDMLNGDLDYNEMMDNEWYRYDRPNYGNLSKPIAKWMEFLTDEELEYDIHDICVRQAKKVKKMDMRQMEEDLRNFVYRYLAYLNNDIDESEFSDHAEEAYPLYAAFWFMAHFHLDSLIDVVLETLKQKSDILQYIYPFSEEETGTSILYELGKDHMDKLEEFLLTPGFLPSTKPIVFDALAYIYYNNPTLKLKALHYISSYLQTCQKIGVQGGDMTNIDHYANTLALVNAKETLPLLKKIYDTAEVPNIEIEGYDDLEEKMKDQEYILEDAYFLMDDILLDIQSFVNKEYEEDDDDESVFDDFLGLDDDD